MDFNNISDVSKFVLPSQQGLPSNEVVRDCLSKIEGSLEILLSHDYIVDMVPSRDYLQENQSDEATEISEWQLYLYQKLVLISDVVKIALAHCQQEKPKNVVKIMLAQYEQEKSEEPYVSG